MKSRIVGDTTYNFPDEMNDSEIDQTLISELNLLPKEPVKEEPVPSWGAESPNLYGAVKAGEAILKAPLNAAENAVNTLIPKTIPEAAGLTAGLGAGLSVLPSGPLSSLLTFPLAYSGAKSGMQGLMDLFKTGGERNLNQLGESLPKAAHQAGYDFQNALAAELGTRGALGISGPAISAIEQRSMQPIKEAASTPLHWLAKRIYTSVNKAPTPITPELRNVRTEELLKHRIGATKGEDFNAYQTAIDSHLGKVDDVLNDNVLNSQKIADDYINIGNIINDAQAIKSRYAGTRNAEQHMQDVDAALNDFLSDFKNKTQITVGDANRYKKSIYSDLHTEYKKMDNGQYAPRSPAETATWKNIASSLKNEIETAGARQDAANLTQGIESNNYGQIKYNNEEAGKLIGSRDSIIRSIARAENKNPLGLIETLGIMHGGPAGVAYAAANNPTWRTQTAFKLQDLADIIKPQVRTLPVKSVADTMIHAPATGIKEAIGEGVQSLPRESSYIQQRGKAIRPKFQAALPEGTGQGTKTYLDKESIYTPEGIPMTSQEMNFSKEMIGNPENKVLQSRDIPIAMGLEPGLRYEGNFSRPEKTISNTQKQLTAPAIISTPTGANISNQDLNILTPKGGELLPEGIQLLKALLRMQ